MVENSCLLIANLFDKLPFINPIIFIKVLTMRPYLGALLYSGYQT